MNKKTVVARRSELAALRDFFAYNTFVRKQYLSSINKLPKKALTKDRGASYPSILDILTHVLDVYRSWFHVYETGEDLPDLKGFSLDQVRKLELEVDKYIDSFMRKLRAQDLNRSFHDTRRGKVITRKLGDMLWHLVEEELQHRGEINALLWQDDIDPPVTSWFKWKRETRKKRYRLKQ